MSKPLWMQRQEEFKKFKSIPIPDAEFNQAIKQLKFDLNFNSEANSEGDYKFNEYLDIRWREFCLDAIRELRNILVSGKCKFGKGLFIGKFNYALFDRIITGNYHCKKKVKECEHRVWVDCEEKYSLYSYQFIEECGFPLFECDGWWKREIFPPLDSQENRPMLARFTKLKFIVNSRTNSIHCKYEIQVQTVGVGAKFLTV